MFTWAVVLLIRKDFRLTAIEGFLLIAMLFDLMSIAMVASKI